MVSIRNRFIILFAAFLLSVISGCKVSYSFSGASISSDVETVSVQYFQNRASLVQPSLSQAFTDALIDKCKAETNLNFITGIGDVNFEGEIVDYNTRPVTVGADAAAATNRFSITIRVKFTNTVEPDFNFDQRFSRYADYSSNLNLSDVESELSEQIIEMIVEDVFNQAFVNW